MDVCIHPRNSIIMPAKAHKDGRGPIICSRCLGSNPYPDCAPPMLCFRSITTNVIIVVPDGATIGPKRQLHPSVPIWILPSTTPRGANTVSVACRRIVSIHYVFLPIRQCRHIILVRAATSPRRTRWRRNYFTATRRTLCWRRGNIWVSPSLQTLWGRIIARVTTRVGRFRVVLLIGPIPTLIRFTPSTLMRSHKSLLQLIPTSRRGWCGSVRIIIIAKIIISDPVKNLASIRNYIVRYGIT